MLKPYVADLHIHTVLSACAEVEMIPPLLMERALEVGLSLIAITDHNSAENVAAVMEAAEETNLTVLPGMEVETKEEVHLLCLFDTLEQALTMQGRVYNHLPPLKNREDVFGPQFVVDATGEFIAYNDRLLLTATSLSLEDVVERVNELGGICIPAHVERPSYSLLANLGFIPPGLNFPALEITLRAKPAELLKQFPDLVGYTLIAGGDAHRLSEINPAIVITMEKPAVAELALAFASREGRKVEIIGERHDRNVGATVSNCRCGFLASKSNKISLEGGDSIWRRKLLISPNSTKS